jgi:type II secretory pathway component GspD/PulD (secretin)
MKRAILLGAIAVYTFHLTVNARSVVAVAGAPDSHSHRAIAIEVLIIGIQGGTKDEYAAQLSGSSEKVAARVRELESQSQAVVIDRIRLTTLENHKMLVQSGRTVPVAAGRSFRGRGGPAQTSYQQQNFGTLLSGTAKVDGDAIVVEFEVENSHLERSADNSQLDDEFVPSATESFTSQVTARIRSGQTIVASGLEKRVGAESSAQLVLASARFLDAPSDVKAPAPSDAEARRVKIFALQNASAKDAATVIRELSDDESGEVKVSVDSRTNSLIVIAGNEHLAVIEAILLRLDASEPRRVSQAAKDEEQSDSTPVVTDYERMDKKELQEGLKRLQKEVLVAERTAKQAKEKAAEGATAYNSASDDEKLDALLRMIEADAASRMPIERFKRIRSDFDAAKRAYFHLLVSE